VKADLLRFDDGLDGRPRGEDEVGDGGGTEVGGDGRLPVEGDPDPDDTAAIGEVADDESRAVVDAINATPTRPGDRPQEDIVITSVTIED